MEKPLILVSNDDGIEAPGIGALAGRLADLGDVLVVAPDRERSAMSHAISLHKPLRARTLREGFVSVDGTPADCVYLALHHFAPRRPALVVSGINHGLNLGSDFFYSGTVAAAVEGAVRGLPAFAISMERPEREPAAAYARAADFAHALAHAILDQGLPAKTLLNVNVPATGPLRGYRFTRLGNRLYLDRVDARTDPRGGSYFWIGGPPMNVEEDEDTDAAAIARGVVSVTPLDLDLTSHALLGQLPGWNLPGFQAVLDEEAPGASKVR